MPINTTNLISTPNIKGDISTCRTEATIVNGSARHSFWVEENIGYMTNNCTGQTDILHSWSFTSSANTVFWLVGILIVMFCLGFGIMKLLKD